jgi:hypothetical protein
VTKSRDALGRVAKPAGDTEAVRRHDIAAKGSPNRPKHYNTKPKPPLPAPDPGSVMSDVLLRQPEGWYQALLDLRAAAEAGDMPAPFAALAAIRCVMDGLVTSNQLLPGAAALQLPPGAHMASWALPPRPDDPEPDPFAGRRTDDLVPVPLWAAVHLASVHVEAIKGLIAPPKANRNEVAAAVDLNQLFGVAGSGSGNRSLLHRTVTRVRKRQMAAAVHALLDKPDRPSAQRAFELVALLFCRDASTVRAAWEEEHVWVEKMKAAAPQTGQS